MLGAHRTRDSVTHWEILDNTFAAIGFRHRCLSLIFFSTRFGSPFIWVCTSACVCVCVYVCE